VLDIEVGDRIEAGQRVAQVHARSAQAAQRAVDTVQAAIALGDAQRRDVVLSRVLLG
jgi:thymidine phosphorylase